MYTNINSGCAQVGKSSSLVKHGITPTALHQVAKPEPISHTCTDNTSGSIVTTVVAVPDAVVGSV